MSENPLLDEIEEFLKTPGLNMSETAFGVQAVNDGKFVKELRQGRGKQDKGRRVWPETAEKVRAFIAKHRVPQSNHFRQARAS